MRIPFQRLVQTASGLVVTAHAVETMAPAVADDQRKWIQLQGPLAFRYHLVVPALELQGFAHTTHVPLHRWGLRIRD